MAKKKRAENYEKPFQLQEDVTFDDLMNLALKKPLQKKPESKLNLQKSKI